VSTGTVVTLAICLPLAALGFYFQRRAWVALWIGIRGIPSSFAAALRGDIDGSLKGLADAVRYLNQEDPS
jgi:hypothetical protein